MIIAWHVQHYADKFQCGRCAHRHCDSDYKIAGSRGPAGYPAFEIKGVIASNTCFLPMVTAQSWNLMDLYHFYRSRHLYAAGGLRDQPNMYIEAMDLLSKCS